MARNEKLLSNPYLQNDMLGRKIVYNTVISIGARIIGLVLSLIIVGFITRYLGQTGFGYYSTILAFLYFFTVLADLGLYSICLREISKDGTNQSKIASNAFTIRFFIGLLIFCLAPIIVCFFPYQTEIKLGVLIGAVGFWLMSNHQVLMSVFQKYLRMDKVALAEFLGRAVQLGIVAFFVWQKLGFLFIVSALVGGSLINFLLVFLFSQKYIRISFKFDFPLWFSLLKESLPLALAIIFTVIYFKLDTIMLSLMKPLADVGIYNLAYKFLESLLFFPAMFVGLIMPLMSKYAFTNREKFRKVTQEALNLLLIIAVPLIIGVFFLSDEIVVLIAGQDFVLSAGVLNVLIIAASIIFLGVLFSNMIISLKKQKWLAYIYGLGALINLTANFILIPKYSYYGAAGTTILTELIVTVLMTAVIYKSIKTLPSFKSLIKCSLAGLFMIAIFCLIPKWNVFVLVILTSLAYFTALWMLGEFSIKKIRQEFL